MNKRNKKNKGKIRQGLAGFLAFCMVFTSFSMESLAGVKRALDTAEAVFILEGEAILESAQAAVNTGDIFAQDTLGLEEEDKSVSKNYKKLFNGNTVYEFMPEYDMEEPSPDGAELRLFVRVPSPEAGYQLTGEEEIIFLYTNSSDRKVQFRSKIDGSLTQKVSVKAFSDSVESAPDEEIIEDANKDEPSDLPGETEEATEENIPENTVAPEDDIDGEPEQADKPHGDEFSGVEVTRSIKAVPMVMAPEDEALIKETEAPLEAVEASASEVTIPAGTEAADDTGNKSAIKGKTYGAILLDESYYARAYVTTLKALNIVTELAKDEYKLEIIHQLPVDGIVYYETEALTLDEMSFDENGNYNYSGDFLAMDGIKAITSDVVINRDSFSESKGFVSIQYALLEGFEVIEREDAEVEEVTMPVENDDGGKSTRSAAVVYKAVRGINVISSGTKIIYVKAHASTEQLKIAGASTKEVRLSEVPVAVTEIAPENPQFREGSAYMFYKASVGSDPKDDKKWDAGTRIQYLKYDNGDVQYSTDGTVWEKLGEQDLTFYYYQTYKTGDIAGGYGGMDIGMSDWFASSMWAGQQQLVIQVYDDPTFTSEPKLQIGSTEGGWDGHMDGKIFFHNVGSSGHPGIQNTLVMPDFNNKFKVISAEVHAGEAVEKVTKYNAEQVANGFKIELVNKDNDFTILKIAIASAQFNVRFISEYESEVIREDKELSWGTILTAPTPPPTVVDRDGKTLHFIGWSTDEYKHVTRDLEVVALYGEPDSALHTIAYHANGAAGDAPQDPIKYKPGATAQVAGSGTMEKPGFYFVGWNTSPSGDGEHYLSNDSLEILDHDVTLYAIWQDADKYIIAFDVEGPGLLNVGEKELYTKRIYNVSGGVLFGTQVGKTDIPTPVANEDAAFQYWKIGNAEIPDSGELWTRYQNETIQADYKFTAFFKKSAQVTVQFNGNSGTKTYNGETQSVDGYTVTGTLKPEHKVADSVKAAASGKDAGTYDVVLNDIKIENIKTGVDVTDEYNITKTPGIFKIEKAPLTVTAENKEREIGQPNPKLDYTVSKNMGNDSKESLKGELNVVLSTTATETSKADNYPIKADGAKIIKNYIVSYVDGTLVVKDRMLTAEAIGYTGTYDGEYHKLITKVTSNVEGVTISYQQANGSYSDKVPEGKNAGTYIINVKVEKENYGEIIIPVTITIQKAALKVTAIDAERKQGLGNPAFDFTVEGLMKGDTKEAMAADANIRLATDAKADSKAGNYAITVSGNNETTNYIFTYVPGNLLVIGDGGSTGGDGGSTGGGGGSTGGGGGSTGGGGGSTGGSGSTGGGSGSTGSGSGTSTGPGVPADSQIPDLEIPLASLPAVVGSGAVVNIEDTEIPFATLPKMGEPGSDNKWLLLIFGTMAALYLSIGGKKKKEEDLLCE